jgi:hypothetical protein
MPGFISAGTVEFFDIKREKIRPDNLRVAQSIFEEFSGPTATILLSRKLF